MTTTVIDGRSQGDWNAVFRSIRITWQLPVVLILAVVSLWLGVSMLTEALRLRDLLADVRLRGRSTIGTVTSLSKVRSRVADRLKVAYTYDVAGKQHRGTYVGWFLRLNDRFHVGRPTPVTYVADQPWRSVPLSSVDLPTRPAAVHSLKVLQSLLPVAFGLILVVAGGRRAAYERRLLREGRVVTAEILAVSGFLFRRIRYRLLSDQPGLELTASCESKYFNPKLGEKIDVVWDGWPSGRSSPIRNLVYFQYAK